MVLVGSPRHPLAARDRVTAGDVDGLRIIGFDRELRIRRNIDRQLAEQGVEVEAEIAFDNIDTIKRAIVVNAGASFLPEPSVQSELQAGELVAIPVEGLRLVRPLGIIHRRGVELGKTARRFIEFLIESSHSAADPLAEKHESSVAKSADQAGIRTQQSVMS